MDSVSRFSGIFFVFSGIALLIVAFRFVKGRGLKSYHYFVLLAIIVALVNWAYFYEHSVNQASRGSFRRRCMAFRLVFLGAFLFQYSYISQKLSLIHI